MQSARLVMMEAVRALVVLALFMLSFGHQPLAADLASASQFAGSSIAAVKVTSFCGGGPAGTDHAPCHACRLGTATALPDPVLPVLPAFANCSLVRYVPPPRAVLSAERRGPASQTGPPLS